MVRTNDSILMFQTFYSVLLCICAEVCVDPSFMPSFSMSLQLHCRDF